MISFYLSMLQTEEERDIFEDFYKKNYDRLVYIAFKNVHNNHDAEEAVAEAFMRMMDKPEKFFSLDEKSRIHGRCCQKRVSRYVQEKHSGKLYR